MEQTKKSTFKLLFYLKKNELKKNGNAPIMARITIDGTPKTFGTKLEIDPNNWDLKHGRVQGKSAQALSINKKLDNIRGRIDKIYEDMLKHEGFATAQKVKLSFLGVGIMDDAILKVFNDQNEDFKKLVEKEERSKSTYNKYITVYNHLTTFIKERYHSDDMAFRELTSDFIREFDFYLRYDLQSSHNTVWVYTMPLCLSTQMPRDIPVGTLSQMGTFITHRLINYQDKEAIASACLLQKRQSMTINRNDKSTSISTQLDSLIPASKISTLTQGLFVGSVSDNFDERIEQKIFHAEIVVDNEKVAAESKAYQQIPQILSFVNEQGEDKMKQEIENNYKQIKSDILNIVVSEMERIKNDPNLQHLVQKE